MGARAIGSGTVSFGLVSIPVKVFSSSESSRQLSFNMLHAECGTRVKQQYYCPKDERTLSRDELARGYEFSKGQYVMLSDEEYKALLEVGSNTIQLTEFVPAEKVDPIFFDRAYYLGPDKGGERAYKLLSDAMLRTGLVGLAKYAARGKQYLVLVRPRDGGGLVMHQLKYPDEVKSFDEVPLGEAPEASDAELGLATQIIEQIASDEFHPDRYRDEVKTRMLELIDQKIEGQEITSEPEVAPQAQVIDLMDALKQSLGATKKSRGSSAEGSKRSGSRKSAGSESAGSESAGRKPAKAAQKKRSSSRDKRKKAGS